MYAVKITNLNDAKDGAVTGQCTVFYYLFAFVCLTVCKNATQGTVYRSIHEDNEMTIVNFTAMPPPGHPFIPLTIHIHAGGMYDEWTCFTLDDVNISQVIVNGTCNDSTVTVEFPASVDIVLEVHLDNEMDIPCDTVVIGPQSKYFCVCWMYCAS